MVVMRVLINMVISWLILLGTGIVFMNLPLGSVTMMVVLPSLITTITVYLMNLIINKIRFLEIPVNQYRKLLPLSFLFMVLYYGFHFIAIDYVADYSIFANMAQSVDFFFFVCYCVMLVTAFIINIVLKYI